VLLLLMLLVLLLVLLLMLLLLHRDALLLMSERAGRGPVPELSDRAAQNRGAVWQTAG